MSDIRNWCNLPEELLRMIAENLKFAVDLLRFGGVCRWWRDVVALDKHHFYSNLKSLPGLMLTAANEEDDGSDRGFYSQWENKKVYRLKLPEARGCHCWGSPYGWLVTLDIDGQIHLLNPVSRARLPLPPLSAFDEGPSFPDRHVNRWCYISKAVVTIHSSSSSEQPQYVVFAIYGGYGSLAFARPGDTKWTTINNVSWHQVDIIQLNGSLYSVDSFGKIWCIDITCPVLAIGTKFAPGPGLADLKIYQDDFAMVELHGQLHMCVRIIEYLGGEEGDTIESHHGYETYYIKVYKLDLHTRKWEQVLNLGDYALFIGSNTTIAVKASDNPPAAAGCCRPNCIYFTDNANEMMTVGRLMGRDMGIFNLETNKVEPFYDQGADHHILSRYSPPVWITPNLLSGKQAS